MKILFSLFALAAMASTVFGQFDASKQCFDFTKGDNEFIAPGPKDIRGVCPGLNVLANHGFLPRNGVATFDQMIEAQMEVFNIGVDVAHLLAAYGLALSGSSDVWHMSIGGPPGDLAPITEQMLRTTFGLSSTHVSFESDGSPTRGDLYEHNSTADVQQARINQFAALYEKQDYACPGKDNYDLSVLGEFRAERLNQSIAENPDFFLSPFGGMLVQAAAHSFIFQLFANRSAEHPEGTMSRETLKSVFGMTVCDDASSWGKWYHHGKNQHERDTDGHPWNKCPHHQGQNGNWGHWSPTQCDSSFTSSGKNGHKYKYQVGGERLPNYWCKRNDNITLAGFNKDTVDVIKAHPDILQHILGGNVGINNSFQLIDINKYTHGTYPSYDFLLQDNNYACIALYQAVFDAPLWLDKMYVNSSKAYKVVTDAVPYFDYLNCPKPKAPTFDNTIFNKFPGWNRSFNWQEWE